MYDYLNGIYVYRNYGSKGYFATIEVNGIGYSCEIMERDYNQLNNENSKIKFYISLIHREDKMSLCGFLRREDRDMFEILTSVSGVGAKMAFALMNSFSAANFISLVLNEDYHSIMKAKGVGQKLAQKIILELKGKLNSCKDTNHSTPINHIENNNISEAKAVLLSLGYENGEISKAIEKIPNIRDISSTEDILKDALRILSL